MNYLPFALRLTIVAMGVIGLMLVEADAKKRTEPSAKRAPTQVIDVTKLTEDLWRAYLPAKSDDRRQRGDEQKQSGEKKKKAPVLKIDLNATLGDQVILIDKNTMNIRIDGNYLWISLIPKPDNTGDKGTGSPGAGGSGVSGREGAPGGVTGGLTTGGFTTGGFTTGGNSTGSGTGHDDPDPVSCVCDQAIDAEGNLVDIYLLYPIIGTDEDDTINASIDQPGVNPAFKSECLLIRGGKGNDTITGGLNKNKIYGDAGNDTLTGNVCSDTIYGGEGDDNLFGMEGDDQLCGDAGEDTIEGDRGNDHVYGADGKDTLTGGPDADIFYESSADATPDFKPSEGDTTNAGPLNP